MNLDYSQFLDAIKKSGIKINVIRHGSSEYKFEDSYGIIDDIKEKLGTYAKPDEGMRRNRGKLTRKVDFIGEMWETGGVKGGSCWDSSDPQEYSVGDSKKPKTFAAFDKILGAICPNISFLQYKLIEGRDDIIVCGEAIDYECYGNRIDYSYRYVDLAKLHKYLIDNSLI